MVYSVAHWDTCDDNFIFLLCKGNILLSILMACVIVLNYNQLGDCYVTWHTPHNTIEHTHAKCHLMTLGVQVPILIFWHEYT